MCCCEMIRGLAYRWENIVRFNCRDVCVVWLSCEKCHRQMWEDRGQDSCLLLLHREEVFSPIELRTVEMVERTSAPVERSAPPQVQWRFDQTQGLPKIRESLLRLPRYCLSRLIRPSVAVSSNAWNRWCYLLSRHISPVLASLALIGNYIRYSSRARSTGLPRIE